MSIAPEMQGRLIFGLPDRLHKALVVADVSAAEMSAYLGVSRNTIGNYTSGRTHPKKQTLRLWAMRTGVPLRWLETGALDPDPGITERNLAGVSFLADRRRKVAA